MSTDAERVAVSLAPGAAPDPVDLGDPLGPHTWPVAKAELTKAIELRSRLGRAP